MPSSEELNRLYSEISDNIAAAMEDILALNVEHKEGKREIGNITEKLSDIRGRFDNELHQLKTHAEWDTFTLAFFGETNAGKSTIIESLRILFKEESREALLQQNFYDLEQFSKALTAQFEQVREGLHALYNEYTDEVTSIRQCMARLAEIVHNEAQERNAIAQAEAQARLELQKHEAAARQQIVEAEAAAKRALIEQESSARLAQEQQEASQRLQIAQAHAMSRFKARLSMFAIGGALIGASAAVALLKLVGA